MSKTILGVIKETKTPPDKRVPLTPLQCVEVMKRFPNVEVIVERSDIRSYKDEEYAAAGIRLVDKATEADILMGVKEVKTDYLIPNKKYFFFSHTFKKQPYNRRLLQAVLEKKIQLIDYETLTDKNKHRIIGFGRYAGIVGCYNGFLAYGKKHNLYTLKPAHLCADRKEMEAELAKIKLPADTKIVLTGSGRVGGGAREIIERIGLQEVSPADFLNQQFNNPVFTQLDAPDYYAKADGSAFDSAAFHKSGAGYISTFNRYLKVAHMYIPCHYWSSSSPVIVTQQNLAAKECKTTVIADISCDIDGPIASTIRPSTIAEPHYGYNPHTGEEGDFMNPECIGVVAVDNLPCELPKDASVDYGNDLINRVLPHLFGPDPDRVIERASETDLSGNLMPDFAYLADYVSQKA
ncbi:MAG: alanine dehydrogenase [Bacteroidetes bacterium]|nr:alanine dehydrogenase [Bacteroidota bacterium]